MLKLIARSFVDDVLTDSIFDCFDNLDLICGGSMMYPQNQTHSNAGSVNPMIASFEILWL
jgi:hypothetical protein